jgi:hypothetical protein
MPRTVFVLALFVLPGPAPVVLAGPPEGASGKMVLYEATDTVTYGLRQYWKEPDPRRRKSLLESLAATRDPRIAVLLGVEATGGCGWGYELGVTLLGKYYAPLRTPEDRLDPRHAGLKWWYDNEADLRRRVKQLP